MRAEQLVVLVLFVVIVLWRASRQLSASSKLPRQLQNARIAYAEQLFRAPGRVLLTAKVDRVCRTRDGVLVLVEFKTRSVQRTYESDVIELSVQRYALSAQTGEPVSDYAYVLVQRPDRRRAWLRVELLSNAQVDALVERREALLAGLTEARSACTLGLCRKCSFLGPCAPKL